MSPLCANHHYFSTEDGSHLIILEPGQALCRQHEPVLLSSSFHDADVVDGQPSFANDLMKGEKCNSQKKQGGICEK